MNTVSVNVFREDKWKEVSELRASEAKRFNHALYHSPVKKFTPRALKASKVRVVFSSVRTPSYTTE